MWIRGAAGPPALGVIERRDDGRSRFRSRRRNNQRIKRGVWIEDRALLSTKTDQEKLILWGIKIGREDATKKKDEGRAPTTTPTMVARALALALALSLSSLYHYSLSNQQEPRKKESVAHASVYLCRWW
jgi:hypothetical protein